MGMLEGGRDLEGKENLSKRSYDLVYLLFLKSYIHFFHINSLSEMWQTQPTSSNYCLKFLNLRGMRWCEFLYISKDHSITLNNVLPHQEQTFLVLLGLHFLSCGVMISTRWLQFELESYHSQPKSS